MIYQKVSNNKNRFRSNGKKLIAPGASSLIPDNHPLRTLGEHFPKHKHLLEEYVKVAALRHATVKSRNIDKNIEKQHEFNVRVYPPFSSWENQSREYAFIDSNIYYGPSNEYIKSTGGGFIDGTFNLLVAAGSKWLWGQNAEFDYITSDYFRLSEDFFLTTYNTAEGAVLHDYELPNAYPFDKEITLSAKLTLPPIPEDIEHLYPNNDYRDRLSVVGAQGIVTLTVNGVETNQTFLDVWKTNLPSYTGIYFPNLEPSIQVKLPAGQTKISIVVRIKVLAHVMADITSISKLFDLFNYEECSIVDFRNPSFRRYNQPYPNEEDEHYHPDEIKLEYLDLSLDPSFKGTVYPATE